MGHTRILSLLNIFSVGDQMRKNIKVNFVFPTNEEDKKHVNDKITEFNREVILAYINNLNCDHAEKTRILKDLSLTYNKNPPP